MNLLAPRLPHTTPTISPGGALPLTVHGSIPFQGLRTVIAPNSAFKHRPRISSGEPRPLTVYGSVPFQGPRTVIAPNSTFKHRLRISSGEPCPLAVYGSVPFQGPEIVRWGSWPRNHWISAFERSETSG
jgi:hypothetical protein